MVVGSFARGTPEAGDPVEVYAEAERMAREQRDIGWLRSRFAPAEVKIMCAPGGYRLEGLLEAQQPIAWEWLSEGIVLYDPVGPIPQLRGLYL
jgi:hypothetical protein